ncbi:hypothetical protein DL95DRAFT_82291 [Leptodontidium sp. 2 PMI_412]|nr:hypothetical protein DL95DRAFT_82291 [Leptodontidium sp. 2 PMI_412]
MAKLPALRALVPVQFCGLFHPSRCVPVVPGCFSTSPTSSTPSSTSVASMASAPASAPIRHPIGFHCSRFCSRHYLQLVLPLQLILNQLVKHCFQVSRVVLQCAAHYFPVS